MRRDLSNEGEYQGHGARAFDITAVKYLAAICLAAFILRGLWALATKFTPLAGDEIDYHRRAVCLMEDDCENALGRRPPVTEGYYAMLYSVFGPKPNVARAGNVAVSVATLLPLYYIGVVFGGRRVGLLAATVAASYPSFMVYSSFLWSETLYIFFTTLAIAFLCWDIRQPAVWKVGLAGLIIGTSALTREVGLFLFVALVAFLAWERRRNLMKGALVILVCLASFLAVVGPWTYRISKQYGHFFLLTTTSYLNLYLGNGPFDTVGEAQRSYYNDLGGTPVERETAAKDIALEHIKGRMPWWPFEKVISEIPSLITPNSFGISRLLPVNASWRYRFECRIMDQSEFRYGLAAFSVVVYVAALLLAAPSLAIDNRGKLPLLLTLVNSQSDHPRHCDVLDFAISDGDHARCHRVSSPPLGEGAQLLEGCLPQAESACARVGHHSGGHYQSSDTRRDACTL
jgi:hypothetical protein